jgi:hypothetical protein
LAEALFSHTLSGLECTKRRPDRSEDSHTSAPAQRRPAESSDDRKVKQREPMALYLTYTWICGSSYQHDRSTAKPAARLVESPLLGRHAVALVEDKVDGVHAGGAVSHQSSSLDEGEGSFLPQSTPWSPAPAIYHVLRARK